MDQNDINTQLIRLLSECYFSVDNEGQVWRHKTRSRTGREYAVTPTRADKPSSNGYLLVKFNIAGKSYSVWAHRVVWMNLHGVIPTDKVINHKNGNRADNHPCNLELVTRSENQRHSFRELGRIPLRGEQNGQSKLNWKSVAEIRQRVRNGLSTSAVAREYGVCQRVVRYVVAHKTWKDLERHE